MSKPELNEKQIAEINCYEEYRKIEEEFRTIFNIDKINGKKDFSLNEARIISCYFGKQIEEIFLEFEFTKTRHNSKGA